MAVSTVKDAFRTVCKIATVASQPRQSTSDRPVLEVELFWATSDQAIFDPTEELVLLESRTGYFESIRYSLVGLQIAGRTQ